MCKTILALLAGLTCSLAQAGGLTDYVDDKAIFAAEADTNKVDFDAIEKWLTETMKAAEMLAPAELASAEQDLHENMARAKQWLADFHKTGGSVLYMLTNGQEFTHGDPNVVIAPVGP